MNLGNGAASSFFVLFWNAYLLRGKADFEIMIWIAGLLLRGDCSIKHDILVRACDFLVNMPQFPALAAPTCPRFAGAVPHWHCTHRTNLVDAAHTRAIQSKLVCHVQTLRADLHQIHTLSVDPEDLQTLFGNHCNRRQSPTDLPRAIGRADFVVVEGNFVLPRAVRISGVLNGPV